MTVGVADGKTTVTRNRRLRSVIQLARPDLVRRLRQAGRRRAGRESLFRCEPRLDARQEHEPGVPAATVDGVKLVDLSGSSMSAAVATGVIALELDANAHQNREPLTRERRQGDSGIHVRSGRKRRLPDAGRGANQRGRRGPAGRLDQHDGPGQFVVAAERRDRIVDDRRPELRVGPEHHLGPARHRRTIHLLQRPDVGRQHHLGHGSHPRQQHRLGRRSVRAA